MTRSRFGARNTSAVLAGIVCAIAICGSLAPFTFRTTSLDQARRRVEVPTLDRLSRFDLVANVALFAPIGFFLMGALRSRTGAAVRVLMASALLSGALEAAQIFTPSRTPSLADFCAELAGAAAGVALWTLRGQALSTRLQRATRDRGQPGPALRLLIAYVAFWSMARLFPFDATFDLHQLTERVRDGRIVLTPFAAGASPARFIMEAVAALPLGVLATLGWTIPGTRRSSVAAATMALLSAGAIGVAQALVDSQSADVTHVLAWMIGGGCAAVVTSVVGRVAAQGPRIEGTA